jgi:hypothetical protein
MLFDIGSRLNNKNDELSVGSFGIFKTIKELLSLKDNPKKTLVFYAYFEKNQEYKKHLQYFLDFSIRESDPVDYVIIIQSAFCTANFPSYKNLRVIRRPNTCFDFGAYGDVMEILGGIQVINQKYKAVMFLNPSAAGPILPKYWPSTIHWTEIFTSKLKGDVHSVGASITCLGDGRGNGPGIEGYASFSTPLAVSIAKKFGVFKCRNNKAEVIKLGEYGLATSLLRAGLNINTLLLKYGNLDWRNTKTWACNYYKHPTNNGSYEGISVHPLESVFQKVLWVHEIPDLVFFHETNTYMEWAVRRKSNIENQV